MINRALIRTKVIQILYAYYQNEGVSLETAEKELLFSLSRAHDLYRHLLQLLVETTKIAQKRAHFAKTRVTDSKLILPHETFLNNQFIAQLAINSDLVSFVETQEKGWSEEELFVKSFLDIILQSDIYNQYIAQSAPSYEADKEFWRKVYKQLIVQNTDLDELLEEQSLYWNDDKEVVDTFVLKTIKRFEQSEAENCPLLPDYKDAQDETFAKLLFRNSILKAAEYRKLITSATTNWEFDRIALMDVILMQTALAEITSFPEIPVNVTLNEFVEISKTYSSAKSGGFINGTLDSIVNQLKNEGILTKN